MNIMPIRLKLLTQTYQALQTTGQMLIRQITDGSLIPAEYQFGGDIGCTYFITLLSKLFHLPLTQSITTFYLAIIGISSITAVFGLWLFAKKWSGRSVALLGVCFLAYISWSVGDEYIFGFFGASWIPLLLYVFEQKNKRIRSLFCGLIGILTFYSNFCRIHTGTLLALVLLLRILFCSEKKITKSIYLSLFILGFGLANFSVKSLFKKRNTYLKEHGNEIKETNHQHTLWHAIYPGLGFITNDKDLSFSDSCSEKKVKNINQNAPYLSPEYNHILKQEVFALWVKAPNFMLRVVFAKLGVLFYYLLLCFLPALWAIVFFYMPLRMQICYGLAIAWGALPGLLTIPNIFYIFGFIASSWLYSLHTIIYALNAHPLPYYIGKTRAFFVQLCHKALHMKLG